MQFSSTLTVLLAFTATATSLDFENAVDVYSPTQDRELILDFDDFNGLFSGDICVAFVEEAIEGAVNATCTCDFNLFPPAVTTGCTGVSAVCGPLETTCVKPQVILGFDSAKFFQLANPVRLSLCFADPTILDFGIPTPSDLCLTFSDQVRTTFS